MSPVDRAMTSIGIQMAGFGIRFERIAQGTIMVYNTRVGSWCETEPINNLMNPPTEF